MKLNKELAIIILAPICYLVGTFGVIGGNVPVALLFYCSESILLSILLYIYSGKTKAVPEDDEIDNELLLNLEQEITEYRQRISALEKEIKEKDEDIEDKVTKLAELSFEKEAEKDNLKAKMGEAFLPPVKENEEDSEIIDIIKIASETAKELEEFTKKAGVRVKLSTSEESLLVRGNKSRMRIMFRNIIDNSVKYMNRAGQLQITISSIGEDIFIVLKDNGQGLSEEETKHIFELNYQGSNRISGNGLGLTQAKAIVDYYGGMIYAKSNNDKGMGIYIQLPTT